MSCDTVPMYSSMFVVQACIKLTINLRQSAATHPWCQTRGAGVRDAKLDCEKGGGGARGAPNIFWVAAHLCSCCKVDQSVGVSLRMSARHQLPWTAWLAWRSSCYDVQVMGRCPGTCQRGVVLRVKQMQCRACLSFVSSTRHRAFDIICVNGLRACRNDQYGPKHLDCRSL